MAEDPKLWDPLSGGTAYPISFVELAKLAPNIHFEVKWEYDPNFRWDGDGPDPEEEGYLPHDVNVWATVIDNGDELSGESHLGGSYKQPDEKDEDIHGYLPQMLDEALAYLEQEINGRSLKSQARKARDYIHKILKDRYEYERGESA